MGMAHTTMRKKVKTQKRVPTLKRVHNKRITQKRVPTRKRVHKIFYRYNPEKNHFYDIRTKKYTKITLQKQRYATRQDLIDYAYYQRVAKNKSIVYNRKKKRLIISDKNAITKKFIVFDKYWNKEIKRDKYSKNKKFDKISGKYIKINVVKKPNKNYIAANKKYLYTTLKSFIIMIHPKESPRYWYVPHVSLPGIESLKFTFLNAGGNYIFAEMVQAQKDGYIFTHFSIRYKVYDKAMGQYYANMHFNSMQDLIDAF